MDGDLVELRVRRRRPGSVDQQALAHLIGTVITLLVVVVTTVVERLG